MSSDNGDQTLFSDKQLSFFADYVIKPVLDRLTNLENNISDLLAELKDDNRGYVPRREIEAFIKGSEKDRTALWKALWAVMLLFVVTSIGAIFNFLSIRALHS